MCLHVRPCVCVLRSRNIASRVPCTHALLVGKLNFCCRNGAHACEKKIAPSNWFIFDTYTWARTTRALQQTYTIHSPCFAIHTQTHTYTHTYDEDDGTRSDARRRRRRRRRRLLLMMMIIGVSVCAGVCFWAIVMMMMKTYNEHTRSHAR